MHQHGDPDMADPMSSCPLHARNPLTSAEHAQLQEAYITPSLSHNWSSLRHTSLHRDTCRLFLLSTLYFVLNGQAAWLLQPSTHLAHEASTSTRCHARSLPLNGKDLGHMHCTTRKVLSWCSLSACLYGHAGSDQTPPCSKGVCVIDVLSLSVRAHDATAILQSQVTRVLGHSSH